jgi:hypothetical protein
MDKHWDVTAGQETRMTTPSPTNQMAVAVVVWVFLIGVVRSNQESQGRKPVAPLRFPNFTGIQDRHVFHSTYVNNCLDNLVRTTDSHSKSHSHLNDTFALG